jgi:hypothetical protein
MKAININSKLSKEFDNLNFPENEITNDKRYKNNGKIQNNGIPPIS